MAPPFRVSGCLLALCPDRGSGLLRKPQEKHSPWEVKKRYKEGLDKFLKIEW